MARPVNLLPSMMLVLFGAWVSIVAVKSFERKTHNFLSDVTS